MIALRNGKAWGKFIKRARNDYLASTSCQLADPKRRLEIEAKSVEIGWAAGPPFKLSEGGLVRDLRDV